MSGEDVSECDYLSYHLSVVNACVEASVSVHLHNLNTHFLFVLAVTIVGRVQRNMRMRRSPHMMSYQIRVDRILNGATESLERDQNLKTIILDTSVEYPARLKRNSDYIFKGNVVKDIFYVSGYESVQSHSNELEGSLLHC